jgi:hypothetical protein
MKIDPKSLLIGLLIATCMFLGVAASSNSTSGSGRYQILTYTNPGGFPTGLIIDTQTGVVWAGDLERHRKDSDSSFFGSKNQ